MNKKNSSRSILAFLGAGLLMSIAAIKIFSKTVIDANYVFTSYLFIGLIFYFMYDLFFKYVLNRIIKIIFTTIAFGGIITCLILCLNMYAVTSKEINQKTFLIVKKGFTTKGRKPKVKIIINNIEKTFIFPRELNTKNHNHVVLLLRRGSLGFDIVEKVKLTK